MTSRVDLLTPPDAPAVVPPSVGEWGGGDEWDTFVSESPDATFCHLAAWRDVFERVLKLRTSYRVARDAVGACAGVLPLVHVRSPLDHYFMSLPFLNMGGPLGSPVVAGALVADAVREARASGVTVMELRTRHDIHADLQVTKRKITVRLGLPGEPAALMESFPAKLRSQIRRPLRAGLKARFGLERWEDFYRVFARHMHELGTPALPKAWFGALAEAFADLAEVGVIYHDNEPVAAGFGFVWREEFELVWASSLEAYNSVSPNMLLYWSLMERVIGRGARTFDFGRCTAGSGTHRFKRQWGGTDTPLPWLLWRPGKRAQRPLPSTDGKLFRLASQVWRRMPYGVATTVGPAIARWLP